MTAANQPSPLAEGARHAPALVCANAREPRPVITGSVALPGGHTQLRRVYAPARPGRRRT